jgi:hypothetical protein
MSDDNDDDEIGEGENEYEEDTSDDVKKTGLVSEIKGDPSAQYVKFILTSSETISATVTPMYIKGTISIQPVQSVNSYEYKAANDVSIAFASSYQNKILKKTIENRVVYFSKFNVMAFTNKISLENANIGKCENGIVWLSAYGSYEELDVKQGDVINSGIYLMSDIKPIDKGNGNYSFEAATKIMIQTKDVKTLFQTVPNVPQSVPNVPNVPQTVPQTTPQTVPQTVPQSVPQAVPQAVKQSAPTVHQQNNNKPPSGWFSKMFGMQGGGGSAIADMAIEGGTDIQYVGGKKEVNMRKLLRSI